MIRRVYICNVANKLWRIGQYFIVDEDREYCLPATPVQTSERGGFHLMPDGETELLFDHTIQPYVIEVGQYTGEEKNDSPIILN